MAVATCVATALEKRRPLPVDAMIPDPLFMSTHAITIDAPPDQVWPWIAQMGGGRAGWYSWDAIDNGGTPSATRVVPEFQTVDCPGTSCRQFPAPRTRSSSPRSIRPGELVLTVPDGHGGNAVAWEHVLDPIEGGRTRTHRPRAGCVELAGSGAQHSRPPVTAASSSSAPMPRWRGFRVRCSSRSRPSATASWKRGTCAAFSDAVRRVLKQERARRPLAHEPCSAVGFSRPRSTSR